MCHSQQGRLPSFTVHRSITALKAGFAWASLRILSESVPGSLGLLILQRPSVLKAQCQVSMALIQ
jgi:hypothetical protein